MRKRRGPVIVFGIRFDSQVHKKCIQKIVQHPIAFFLGENMIENGTQINAQSNQKSMPTQVAEQIMEMLEISPALRSGVLEHVTGGGFLPLPPLRSGRLSRPHSKPRPLWVKRSNPRTNWVKRVVEKT